MLEKRSLTISGHATSLALEPEFWAVLDAAAREDGRSLASLVRMIDEARVETDPDQPLSSAARVWALRRVQAARP
ncbi:aryl-sulfate sulfotransferase [Marinicauda salina]|uniref:Aryl-sulfate sulfotransferase n=1 Tax=Marinicauda salina TaxID=2135793 RepID=A0A2U2BSG1_9PROT|nr:ribbon-helix-helix domain-containing protein [Marinicauda salina]PWE16951.1 aryl-sulfate sulfotransferase [Marinicauda salina]